MFAVLKPRGFGQDDIKDITGLYAAILQSQFFLLIKQA
jgi:hypothetical protein